MDVHSICNVSSFVNLWFILILCQKVRYMKIETNINKKNIKLLKRSTLSLSLIPTTTVTWKVKILLKGPSSSTHFQIGTLVSLKTFR